MAQLYRRELVNLKNEEEAKILVEIAGKALIQTEPEKIVTIKISDETEDGRKEILSLLKQGYKIESIVHGSGQNKVKDTRPYKKFIKDVLKIVSKNKKD